MSQISEQKLAEWTQLFMQHIRERSLAVHVREDEGYKFEAVQQFRTNFDLASTDLVGMLDASLANNNLVSGAMYFPKRMLLIYAQTFPEETRAILAELFNDNEEVGFRIDQAKQAFEDLEQRRDDPTGRTYNTYIGLRFLSLLLSYYDPNQYNALKPAEWKVFCRFVDPDFSMPQRTMAGEQYKIYNQYIDALREYIKTRPEVTAIRDELTKGLSFRDDEYRWIGQDVIFVTSRVYANHRAKESYVFNQTSEAAVKNGTTEVNADDDFNTGFMAYEQHLEEYVIKNWDKIDFGEKLHIYIDDEGTTGQQFTTDVGVMDILATDANGDYVVIELKRAESGYKVVGQVLNYMGWVQEKLVQGEQKVRGLIIVGRADKTLCAALRPVANMIALKEYQVQLSLVEPEGQIR